MENRRLFIKKVLGALGLGLVTLKGHVASAKKLALSIDKVAALKKVGGSAKVKLKGKDVLLIRDSEKTVKGVCPKCTHQQCLVHYNNKSKKIECSCHGASFDLNGKVLGGPAPKDLKSYPATLSGDKIIVDL